MFLYLGDLSCWVSKKYIQEKAQAVLKVLRYKQSKLDRGAEVIKSSVLGGIPLSLLNKLVFGKVSLRLFKAFDIVAACPFLEQPHGATLYFLAITPSG